MNLTGGIILYAVLWFLALFIIVPIGYRSQGDMGEVVPGTPEGAPAVNRLKKQSLWATLIAALIWAPIAWVILSGRLNRDHLEMMYQWFRG